VIWRKIENRADTTQHNKHDSHSSLGGEDIMDIIKVSARSRTRSVAGAIAGIIRDHNRVRVHAIGAGAVNQAIKAAALARHYLEQENVHICIVPYFTDIAIEEKDCTAIELVIEPRDVTTPRATTIPVARQEGLHLQTPAR
jgi:stage V sporulation protein S